MTDTTKALVELCWLATEDGSIGKGTGRHIACFVLDGSDENAVTHNA